MELQASSATTTADDGRAIDPLLGRVVASRYRLDAVIGAGASGVVYRAEHLGLRSVVAVKVPSPALLSHPDARKLFRREARAAARFDHPNSVRVHDFGTEPDGLTYLVMELLEGRELLAPILEEPPMSPDRIVDLLGQVLDALSAAHDAGIVHRDLKPENIVIVQRDGKEVAKITDYGIAKPFGGAFQQSAALTVAGMLNGTPTYMAPEQALGEELDGRADLYAVGVILYELLCGTPPFTDDKPFDLILAHLMRPPTPPSDRRAGVHAGLEAVALRALTKKRDGRFADAREMRAALQAAIAGAADARSGVREVESRPEDEDSRATLVAVDAKPAEGAGGRTRRAAVRWLAASAIVALLGASAVLAGSVALRGARDAGSAGVTATRSGR